MFHTCFHKLVTFEWDQVVVPAEPPGQPVAGDTGLVAERRRLQQFLSLFVDCTYATEDECRPRKSGSPVGQKSVGVRGKC